MKRWICLLCIVCLSCFVFAGCGSYEPNEVVYVYNWGEYIDPTVNDLFTKETGITVIYDEYDNNESMYAILKSGGAKYDVVFPSDYMVARLIEEDMVEPIDFDNVPNFEHIMDNLKNPTYDPQNKYSVPYTWGMVGLMYNAAQISEKPTSWSALWDPAYKGKTLLYNNPRDTIGISLLKNGYSLNTTNEAELRKAADDLIAQKENLQAYVSDEIFNIMESGSAYLCAAYAGDILTMMEQNEDLAYSIPTEGTNRFVDAMCIVKGSVNKTAAEKYINFLCRKDIAELNRAETNYSTPQQQTYEALDDEIKKIDICYPSDEIIQNTEIFTNLPKETLALYTDLWAEIKK